VLSSPLRDISSISIHGERILYSSARHEQALTGVPLSTGAKAAVASKKTATTSNNMYTVSTPIPETSTDPPLWFERPRVLSHWVQRGRKALAELEIDVVHGVVSPNKIGRMGGEK
jgi:hypothetical protein